MIMNVSVKSLDVLQLFMNIISIYIQFQLLTNISNIALSHHFENESKRLNVLRIMKHELKKILLLQEKVLFKRLNKQKYLMI